MYPDQKLYSICVRRVYRKFGRPGVDTLRETLEELTDNTAIGIVGPGNVSGATVDLRILEMWNRSTSCSERVGSSNVSHFCFHFSITPASPAARVTRMYKC